jgi:3-oxoacyl-[acyl-carrier-protein] synthase II
LKRLDRYAQFAVASAKLALEDSGVEYSADNPHERIGVSFGTALGGVSNAEIQHKAFVGGGPRSVNHMLALQVFGGQHIAMSQSSLGCVEWALQTPIAAPAGTSRSAKPYDISGKAGLM